MVQRNENPSTSNPGSQRFLERNAKRNGERKAAQGRKQPRRYILSAIY